MKRYLWILLIFACPSLASAACVNTNFSNGWTCVQQKGVTNAGAGSTSVATLGSNTGAGHQVVVFGFVCGDASCNIDTTPITLVMTDGTGDAVTTSANSPCLTDSTHKQFYAWVIPNVSVTNTFTVTATGGTPFYLSAFVSEWTGGASSSVFDLDGTCGSGSAATASQTAGTSTNANDLVVGHIQLGAANAVTAGAGFTEIGEDLTGEEHEAMSVTSTGSQSCTWSFTSTAFSDMCIAIKAGAGGVTRHRISVMQN